MMLGFALSTRSAQLTLGQFTSNNPGYWQDAGDTYATKVGYNIVQAEIVGKGIKTASPFVAIAKPDNPDPNNITPVGDNDWTLVQSYAGFISLIVKDQYGNPVANVPVTYITQAGVKHPDDHCPYPAQPDKAKLISMGEQCLTQGVPTWAACGSDSAMILTATEGNAPVGGMPNALYKVSASLPAASGQWQREFTQYTYGFNICAGQGDPIDLLLMQALYPADITGRSILAAKAGSALSMRALLTHLHEGDEVKDVQIPCGGVNAPCKDVVGTGLFDTRTDYENGKVAFGAVEGAASIAGDYRAQYTLAAGVNVIETKGSATVNRQEAVQSCSGGCYLVDKYKELQSGSSTLTAYGVDIQIAELPVMVLDGDGLTVGDYEVPYTIVPAEYVAGSAVVYIYRDGGLFEVLPAELSGQGFIKFSAGSHFDIESNYEVEVVLNTGTSAEIKTDRKPLLIAQLMIINDVTSQYVKTEKELKYSRGEAETKRYRVAIRRNGEYIKITNCGDFTATLSTVSKRDNQAVQPPSDKYAKSTVELKFVPNMINVQPFYGECVSVNGESEAVGSFFFSNLKITELGDVVQSRQPIYAGIGSKLSLDLYSNNELHPINATREFAIEPVGVILIGIDGLRQDVLYEDKDSSGNRLRAIGLEGNSYHVPPAQLTGLCEILGGKYGTTCDITGMENKHIKMKDVTAIFPSITLASWASIFTGKQANETGVMGNEYFARDLIGAGISVPDIYNPPSGMVTYDSGALKGYDAFSKLEKASSDFFVPAEQDPSITPQNTTKMLLPETIFESITKMPGVLKYFIERGGDPSVSVLFHYARGAKWVTYKNWKLPLWYHFDESKTLDDMSWEGVKWYLNNEYVAQSTGQRNDVPFSALTAWYLPGLDHDAHFNKGMEGYVNYFKGTIDPTVKKLVDKLKDIGEFDNKIFIVVADHGHTDMPKASDMILEEPLYDNNGGIKKVNYWYGYDKCAFNYDLTGRHEKWKKNSEKANNNLHIWELAEMLRLFPTPGVPMKVLAPKEIVAASSGAALNADEANVIAALNGPMAHIYVKGTSWKSDPDQSTFKSLLQRLSQSFSVNNSMQGEDYKTLEKSFPRLMNSIELILVRGTLTGEYKEYVGIKKDAQGMTVIDSKGLDFAGHEYVRALDRVKNLNNSDRSGDILLIMKDNTNDTVIDRFTSGVACKSWHGSLNPSDSYVPFIFSYPGGSKQEIESMINTVCASDKCNGNWAVTETIKAILEKQFQQ